MADHGRILSCVREEIGCDADHLPDSELQGFVEYVQSDEEGKLALNSLLDPQSHCRSLPPQDCCDISGFSKRTQACAALNVFWKFYVFRLVAPEIGKAYRAHLRPFLYRFAHAIPDHVKGMLYYNNEKELEGVSFVIVKEWYHESNLQCAPVHHGHGPRRVEYPLCASFYRGEQGCDEHGHPKCERIACFISEIKGEDNKFTILSGNGAWHDIIKGKAEDCMVAPHRRPY